MLHGAMLEEERGGAETVQGADERQSRSAKLRPCEGEKCLANRCSVSEQRPQTSQGGRK